MTDLLTDLYLPISPLDCTARTQRLENLSNTRQNQHPLLHRGRSD